MLSRLFRDTKIAPSPTLGTFVHLSLALSEEVFFVIIPVIGEAESEFAQLFFRLHPAVDQVVPVSGLLLRG